jgi:Mg-chelatase subunit ChlD
MNTSARFFTSAAEPPAKAGILLKGDVADVRQSVHLIFVIDVSDSMNDSGKLGNVKKSMEFIIPLLQDDDLVSVITFGETSDILLDRISAAEKSAILYKVQGLKTDGCTNMSAGLMNIRSCLEGHSAAASESGAGAAQSRKTGILMLTDGHANRGASSPEALKEIVTRITEEWSDLTLTTIGYSHDHFAALLQDMATVGKGSYNVVYNLEQVATTFGEVLGGLTTVVAQNVVVHLPPNSKPLTGYTVIEKTNGVKEVRVGDVYAENEVIVLCELPAGVTEVRITGHNMVNHSIIDAMVPVVVPSVDECVPKAMEQAHYRYEVSSLLKAYSTNSQAHSTADWLAKAEGLCNQLKGLSYASEQLVQMMIDDMENMMESLRNPRNYLSPMETTQMAQHSAYLALGRGLRVASSQPMEDPQPQVRFAMPASAPASPPQRTAQVDNLQSPFSNRAQRNVTSILRATSSQQQ